MSCLKRFLVINLYVFGIYGIKTGKPHSSLTFDPVTGLQFPPSSNGNFINPGTPGNVDPVFDCDVRMYAYEYGMQIQPRHGNFVSLFDALQLGTACNQTRPKEIKRNIPNYDSKLTGCEYYVDPINGDDRNIGTTIEDALLTIEKAIKGTRKDRINDETCVINLMEGTFYLSEQVLLTEEDSNLIIQNYNGSDSIVSGGVVIDFGSNEWELETYETPQWMGYNNSNNVFGRASKGNSNDLVRYIGNFNSFQECQQAIETWNANPDGPMYYSFTWHNASISGFGNQCFGVRDISWSPVKQDGIYSARYIGKNVWKRKIVNTDEFKNKIYGLRVNESRGIKARYPDQNPGILYLYICYVSEYILIRNIVNIETAMQYDPLSGWVEYNTVWSGPFNYPAATDIIVNNASYPDVEWPMVGPGTGNGWTGEGCVRFIIIK